jgi:hypothetical protein
MNTYKAGDQVNADDVKAGFSFVGADGITYTVTERTRVTWDDAPISMTYLTLTDGQRDYTVELEELVKQATA